MHEHFFERIREVSNISITLIFIFIFSNGLLFIFKILRNMISEVAYLKNKKNANSDLQKKFQPIGSDISLIISMLDTLSNYGFL
jgi:hypothetical protein